MIFISTLPSKTNQRRTCNKKQVRVSHVCFLHWACTRSSHLCFMFHFQSSSHCGPKYFFPYPDMSKFPSLPGILLGTLENFLEAMPWGTILEKKLRFFHLKVEIDVDSGYPFSKYHGIRCESLFFWAYIFYRVKINCKIWRKNTSPLGTQDGNINNRNGSGTRHLWSSLLDFWKVYG